MGPAWNDALANADALLYGRRTWQGMAAAWLGPRRDPFADRMNAIPKYVVTSSLGDDDMEWNTTRIPGERRSTASASSARGLETC